jgi:hypothetical protein
MIGQEEAASLTDIPNIRQKGIRLGNWRAGQRAAGYLLRKCDLIVAMTEQSEGLLGSCAFVPEDNLYLHNQRLGLISADKKK